jgi:XTP/dITP diphosphohydrolase
MGLKILIATTNQGKINEIHHLFLQSQSNFTLYSLKDLQINQVCPEKGETFLENAAEKSVFYSKLSPNMYCVGDDSGLMVEALGGKPGVRSARFAGPEANDDSNTQKLLQKMKHTNNRNAKFVTAVSLSKNGKLIKSFISEVEGTILNEKRGKSGFGYDPVFYYPPLKKTFAEISTTEKNKISHRAKAFNKLKEFLNHLI